MKKYSLTKAILQSKWISDGIIEANDGSIYKSFEMEPFSVRYAGMFHCYCGQIGRHISKKSIITKFQTLGITFVFNMNKPDNLRRVVTGEKVGTLVRA